MAENRQVLIASLPTGALASSDFEMRTAPMPEAADGEVLCAPFALTIGAGQRAGLQGSASYAGAPEAGRRDGRQRVAEVVESRRRRHPPGRSSPHRPGGKLLDAMRRVTCIYSTPVPIPRAALGVLGTNGLTAYFGLLEVGQPQPGNTVVVSAAAGSVGHIVGQIAKMHGCRVVGITGADDKCRMLVDELGFDVAVSHRTPSSDRIQGHDADRIDVYFDNTGGTVLVARCSAWPHGRIVCCGVVASTTRRRLAPAHVASRACWSTTACGWRASWSSISSIATSRPRRDMSQWVADGSLKPKVTEFHGLEEAPQAFVELLAGRTVGTTVVTI